MAAPPNSSSKSASTFDLLRWPDQPSPSASQVPSASAFMSISNPLLPDTLPDSTPSRTPLRNPQASGGIASILHGANLTPQEAEALQKRKPNSEYKKREMSGSGIFSQEVDVDSSTPLAVDKPMVRVHQPAGGVSQISFGVDGAVSPKKPSSVPELAKQRELTGTLDASAETPSRKPSSTAKVKELVGSNIFSPPTDLPPRSLSRSLDEERQENEVDTTPIATPSKLAGAPNLVTFGQEDPELSAKKSNTQKVAELSGNNIFKDNAPSALPEKSLSAAKRREISGNDIFADEKPVIREHVGGIRKPPGGESSLTLV